MTQLRVVYNSVSEHTLTTITQQITSRIGNGSVPQTVINDTRDLFFKTTISILVISNHNSFRVFFDKIAFVYFI